MPKIMIPVATQSGSVVRGAVQGKAFEIPVGKESEITDDQLNCLKDSTVQFEMVDDSSPSAGEDSGEGSPESSTAEDEEPETVSAEAAVETSEGEAASATVAVEETATEDTAASEGEGTTEAAAEIAE